MSEIGDYKLNDTHYCKSFFYDFNLKMKYRANILKKDLNIISENET